MFPGLSTTDVHKAGVSFARTAAAEVETTEASLAIRELAEVGPAAAS
jgi:hypothetical protein